METIEEVLADVKQEGANPFADMEEETPTESLPETKPEDETTENKEEDLPFHKHPRWIERENELKDEREQRELLAKEVAELKSFRESVSTVETDIPAWFSELYGDNANAWQKYQLHEQERTAEIEARILAGIDGKKQQEVQENQKWEQWVADQITTLEGEGNKFDKNRLTQIMLEYSPTDANNNLDFRKGLAIYNALEEKPDTAKADARKQLADTTTKSSNKPDVKKEFMTVNDLRNTSWNNL